MKVFRTLGRRVDDCWRSANYSEDALPEIAASALAEANLPESVSPWDIVRWLGSESQLPTQHDIEAHFGNPPITLFSGARFYIDIYFWVNGTTEIHQHAFAGAFQVLAGSSIHSRYSFNPTQKINQHFHLGTIALEEVELLQIGDIRKIIPGPQHIHALFHLDRPSASIAIRTLGLPANQPQFSYLRPHVAVDPFYADPILARKLQTVEMLLTLQKPEYDDLIRDLLAGSDLHTTYLMLRTAFANMSNSELDKMFHMFRGRERFDGLVSSAREKHGDNLDRILPAIHEQERISDIVRRRQFIAAPDHRFFLALLLNVPNRGKFFDLVQARFPERDPVETALDWISELSTTKVLGSGEANALGINEFDDDHLFVLECLLRGQRSAEIKDAIAKQYPPDYGQKLTAEFDSIAARLRGSTLFRALLVD